MATRQITPAAFAWPSTSSAAGLAEGHANSFKASFEGVGMTGPGKSTCSLAGGAYDLDAIAAGD
jgi:hypothetical protein